MRAVRLSSLLLLALLAGGCATSKPFIVGGREMDEAEAKTYAENEVARLRTSSANLPPDRAAQAWEALAQKLGDLPPAADAYYEAALKWRAARKPDRAAANLGQLLTRFPLSTRASDAKYQLAMVQLETGRPRDAMQTLTSLYDKLPPGERLDSARRLAEASESARAWPQAAQWHGEAASRLQGADREKELARAKEIIDGRLTPVELARLHEDLPKDSPVLPFLMVKLAQNHLQQQRPDLAQATAQEVIQRWPESPSAAEARTFLERLSRRSKLNPHVVGLAIPTSGKFKGWGEAIQQAVSLAMEGSGLKVVVRDTHGDAAGVAQAMEALVVEEGAMAVVGGVANAEAQRAASAAQELGVPFVSLSKVEGVTDAGPFVFRNMLTASAQTKALSDFAWKRGMRRFALLYPDIPYGQELANSFWDEVEERGGEIRGAEIYENDRTTFAPLVKSMVGKLYLDERHDWGRGLAETLKGEKNPYRRAKAIERARKGVDPIVDFDAIFIPDFAKNVTLIAPALAVEDVVTITCDPRGLEHIRKSTGRRDLKPVQLLGSNGWDDPSLFEKVGRYVECAVIVDGFFAGSERPETKRFTGEFQKKYDHPPTILEASAYDAIRMVRQILERERPQSREAMRTSLSNIKDYKGATGDLSFDSRREPQKQLFFLTVDKNGLREMTREELEATGAPGS